MNGEGGDDLGGDEFPYQLIKVSGIRALHTLKELKEAGAGVFTPVILGSREELERTKEMMRMRSREAVEQTLKELGTRPNWLIRTEEQREQTRQLYLAMVATPEEIIERAGHINPRDYFAEQRGEVEAGSEGGLPVGEWPDKPLPKQGVTAHWDYRTNKPKEEVFIAKVPTPRSWEAPAFLGFGNWNACPAPEVHVSLHQYWNENFGTDIISVTGDVIECTVASPPQGREIATALAWEQFVYCTDIVEQGIGTVAALADTLLGGPIWYFWWD